jgi:hypothetical protein
MLVEYTIKSQIDNDHQLLMNILGIIVRNIVTHAMNIFVVSWNNHRIRGPCKGIPNELAQHSPIQPLPEEEAPQIDGLVNEYNFNRGAINSNLATLKLLSFQKPIYSLLII